MIEQRFNGLDCPIAQRCAARLVAVVVRLRVFRLAVEAARSTVERFRTKALKDSDVEAAYNALSPAYEMKRQMIELRKKAGLT